VAATPNGTMTSLRLPQELLDRADSLTAKLAHLATLTPSGQLVRSDVLRLALTRGLDALELEARAARASKRGRTK
jgi:predicted DNA-binding protein